MRATFSAVAGVWTGASTKLESSMIDRAGKYRVRMISYPSIEAGFKVTKVKSPMYGRMGSTSPGNSSASRSSREMATRSSKT